MQGLSLTKPFCAVCADMQLSTGSQMTMKSKLMANAIAIMDWSEKHMTPGKLKGRHTGGKDMGIGGMRADRLDAAVVAAELADTACARGVPQVQALIA